MLVATPKKRIQQRPAQHSKGCPHPAASQETKKKRSRAAKTMKTGAEFLWDVFCACGFLFCCGRGGIQRLETPVCKGTAFCRAVGTASFYSGACWLCFGIRQYLWKTMLAHQCERGSASLGSSRWKALSPRSRILLNLIDSWGSVKHTEIGGSGGRERARCFSGQACP